MTKHLTPRAAAVRAHAGGAVVQFPVVAVGASAGGLEAFIQLLDILPANSGMAMIFVQHLDPMHQSMMAALLAPHTTMRVCEAVDRTVIEPNTVYVIAPGTYIGIRDRALTVGEPKERHGARMPFDFLLRSMAAAYGDHAMGVVLSGTGLDGNVGLKAIKDHGGLVVAQDPGEAAFPGMPQSAIDAGVVDRVLPIRKIPASLTTYADQMRLLTEQDHPFETAEVAAELGEITDLLRERAGQDFAEYKSGTLMRRTRRRMAIHAIGEVSAYVALLRTDAGELDALAKDLLIHVTSFFRDAAVFDLLAAKVVPEIVRKHPVGHPLRVWVPACSTGEEVYSLAMVFLESIAAAQKNIKLQMFGTDIDEQAVSAARSGVYPNSLKDEVSARAWNVFSARMPVATVLRRPCASR